MTTPYNATSLLQANTVTCHAKAQERFCGVLCVEGQCDTPADILDAYSKDFAGRGNGGWRAIGEILDVSGGTAYEIAHGNRPITHEQTLRWRVYQETIGRDNPNVKIVQTTTCPSCGQLHQVQDCHNTVGQVALIPQGATMRLPKPTPPAWVSEAANWLAARSSTS